MSVALRRQRDGKLRPYWYGEYTTSDGKRKVENLGRWRGKPPPALLGTGASTAGDADFEASREAAEKKLRKHAEDAQVTGSAAHLIERLIEVKTGHKVEHARIDELAKRWKDMPRGDDLTVAHSAGVDAVCKRFRLHMAQQNDEAVYLYQVTQSDAGSFVKAMRKDFAPRTARGYAALLRSAFRRFLPAGAANPFDGIVNRTKREAVGEDMIHRKPFTSEELQALVLASKGDILMDGLITAAACTGMRRGDVCRLRWSDLDLAAGMVTVKTSKTGSSVEIPIFNPLRAVLEERKGNRSEYVFPSAAAMLEENPDGLTYRFKALVARTLDPKSAPTPPKVVPAAEIEAEGAAAIAQQITKDARRERILDTFHRYCAGASLRQIEKATGRARATVSVDLHAAQRIVGKRFLRNYRGPDIKERIARVTRVTREKGCGKRAASIRDWHALRTTFVTLALTAGVPMELVKRVTGHATVDVVLRHYFRPDREQFRAVLTNALPDVLTGSKAVKQLTGAEQKDEEVDALFAKVKTGTASGEEKTRLRKLLDL